MEDELLKAAQEIQISQRFMLKRLNEIYHTSDGQCSCARSQEHYRREIDELESKVKELESVINEKDTLQKEEEKEHQELKERVELLETFVMTLQTDDSKIHSATLKQKRDEIENGHAVSEKVFRNANLQDTYQTKSSENVSQVYRTHSIEYSKASTEKSTSDDVFTKKTVPQEKLSPLLAKSKENTVAQEPVVKKDNFVSESRKKQTALTKGSSRLLKPPVKEPEGASRDAAFTMESIKMVEQTERKTHGNEGYWRYLARIEIEDGQRTLRDLQGVHTTIILDISASMAEENAWTHASRFVLDYLNGLEEISTRYGLSNEHVALVTFGHDTRVQQRLTNKYKLIRQLVENQRLGGPSPLYGGLALAIAAAGSSIHHIEKVNQVAVFHKVIIVTDGFITEVGQYEGPDKAVEDLNETKAKLIQIMEEFKGSQPDMYYVQVGKGSEETRQFSELMMAIVDGKKLDYKSGRQFSRRTYLTSKISDPFGLDPLSLFGGGRQSFEDCSQEDKLMIEEIKSDARKSLFTGMLAKQSRNTYKELSGSNLPPLGSRVRRGPDWHWDMQDSNGPGTVVGHGDDGVHVWVEWDEDGRVNVYGYGATGYDVLIVDEPRKLKIGQEIAVGCVVRPGKDWTKSAGNAQNWQRGVVIKVTEPKATVRWEDKERGDYTYSGTGKCEIEVCSGFRAFGSEGHTLGSDFTERQPDKKKKNKNKNVN
ncbi:uncharacterized protein LOC132732228 isoform X2 [Ruditapes philippinarum]|uniref:uncharacterized protein LOC132732228 isoform X2 n=1 Tax=Ruditapes philippinarum TaxID=129788 RepID=UPI00295A6C88|nr:uncharacterized protein LOC132732228 isoform X2 [Ruditapes philippinarum]